MARSIRPDPPSQAIPHNSGDANHVHWRGDEESVALRTTEGEVPNHHGASRKRLGGELGDGLGGRVVFEEVLWTLDFKHGYLATGRGGFFHFLCATATLNFPLSTHSVCITAADDPELYRFVARVIIHFGPHLKAPAQTTPCAAPSLDIFVVTIYPPMFPSFYTSHALERPSTSSQANDSATMHMPHPELQDARTFSLEQQFSALHAISKLVFSTFWGPLETQADIDKTVNVGIKIGFTPKSMQKLEEAISKDDRIHFNDYKPQTGKTVHVLVRVGAVKSWGPKQPGGFVRGSIYFCDRTASVWSDLGNCVRAYVAADSATRRQGYECSLSFRNISTLLSNRLDSIIRRDGRELDALIDFRWLITTFPVKTKAIWKSELPKKNRRARLTKYERERFHELLEERQGSGILSVAHRERFKDLGFYLEMSEDTRRLEPWDMIKVVGYISHVLKSPDLVALILGQGDKEKGERLL
ncbi:hypothetical protein QBC39DRAFT_338033 [Podospora conica]|nr:hypothetical protein QBC39DRAFT_338033 [Schizothecium conicum]